MKKFTYLIAEIAILIIVVLGLLDLTYSAVYQNAPTKRGKAQDVYTSEARDYDVVILGSSRANNHLVAQMFEDKGLKCYNYGVSGSHLFESALFLKLMMERKYTIKNIIIETDINLNSGHRSDATCAQFLPYIHNSEVIRDHFSEEEDFGEIYYVPFYRYLKFDYRIGFREMFLNAIGKKTIYLDNLGYYKLNNVGRNLKSDITEYTAARNHYYEEIKQICADNKINLIAVTTPMCENVVGMDFFEKIKKVYPEIHNYENAVQGDQYFSSCGHMNDAGAKLFTGIIINDFFTK